jgi:hypothetical protein
MLGNPWEQMYTFKITYGGFPGVFTVFYAQQLRNDITCRASPTQEASWGTLGYSLPRVFSPFIQHLQMMG